MLPNILSAIDEMIFDLNIARGHLLNIVSNRNTKVSMPALLKLLDKNAENAIGVNVGAMHRYSKDQKYLVFDKEDGDADIYRGWKLFEYGKFLGRFVAVHKDVLATLVLLDTMGYYGGRITNVRKKDSRIYNTSKSPGTTIIAKTQCDIYEMVQELIKRRDEIPDRIHLFVYSDSIKIAYARIKGISISRAIVGGNKRKNIVF